MGRKKDQTGRCCHAGKKYADYILEDYNIRKYLKKRLYHAGISKVEIERSSKRVRLRVFTSRPGIVIGKKGAEIALLKKELEKIVSHEVIIDIQEVISELANRNIGILITDHNVRETLGITDRAYIMNEGEIIVEGAPTHQIADHPAADTLGDLFLQLTGRTLRD